MISESASISLVAASILSLFYPLIVISMDISQTKVSNSLVYLIFSLITFSFSALIYAHCNDIFTISNVYSYSHSSKPLIYKFAGTWGNHEGSMLMWIWILNLYTLLFNIMYKKERRFKYATISIQLYISLLFISFLMYNSDPFATLAIEPDDGLGFNPMLQDIALLFHPPILYAGYVGLSIAYSISTASMLVNKSSRDWIRICRVLTLISWSFLTLGIALGSWWAYRELGWGGFWFWDPVENASLIPWLSATALIHALILLEKRGNLYNLSIFLSIITFCFSVIGTFLVRSGILNSVHSFASDPDRGLYILIILTIIFLFGTVTFILKSPKIKKRIRFQIFSKSFALIINNLLLITLCITVLNGTIYPIINEYLFDETISIGANYYNITFNNIMMVALIMMILGSNAKSRYRKYTYIIYRYLPSFIVSSFSIIWTYEKSLIVILAILLSVWLCISLIEAMIKTILRSNHKTFIKKLYAINISYYSMFISHLGLGIMIIGITASIAWEDNYEDYLNLGNTVHVGEYEIKFEKVEEISKDNFKALRGTFKLQNGIAIFPENRFYIVEQMKSIESAVHHTLFSDVYIIMGDYVEDNGFIVRIYYKPLINLIWLGAIMIAVGGLIGSYRSYKRIY